MRSMNKTLSITLGSVLICVLVSVAFLNLSCNTNVERKITMTCSCGEVDSTTLQENAYSRLVEIHSVRFDSVLFVPSFLYYDMVWGVLGNTKVAILVARRPDCKGSDLRMKNIVDMCMYRPVYFKLFDTVVRYHNSSGGVAVSIDSVPMIPVGYSIWQTPCLCSNGRDVYFVEAK